MHASIAKRTLWSRARNEGYVGRYILLPKETLENLDSSVYTGYLKERLERKPDYLDDPRDQEFLFNAAAISITQDFGRCNEAEIFARLFAGDSAVDRAVRRAKSNDFQVFSQHLTPTARELSERAVAYLPFMGGDATLVGNDKYSYAPLMEA